MPYTAPVSSASSTSPLCSPTPPGSSKNPHLRLPHRAHVNFLTRHLPRRTGSDHHIQRVRRSWDTTRPRCIYLYPDVTHELANFSELSLCLVTLLPEFQAPDTVRRCVSEWFRESKVTSVSQRRITSNDHLISGILLTVKITVQSPVECEGGYFTVESLSP